MEAPFGFNIIGMASADLGLGLTTREFARTLSDLGYPVCILDLDAGHGRSKKNDELMALEFHPAGYLPYAVNIFVEGAHIVPAFALNPPKAMNVEDRLNVGFIWWELAELPESIRLALGFFDVLLAGSEFVRATMSNHVDRIPVVTAEHPLNLDAFALCRPNRSRFGLPEDSFVVGMSFDPYSDLSRKNPFASVEAFRTAFSSEDNCRLIIKMNTSYGVAPKTRLQVAEIRRIAAQDKRIHLVEETLPYIDLLSLYASLDVLISLHRAEGLGLAPMEAMLLGKPVVATAWSGNMSYMDHRNSCLVASNLIPVCPDSARYSPRSLGMQGTWADPIVEHAATWLRKLYGSRDLRHAIGRQARADVSAYQQRAKVAGFAQELRALWEVRDCWPQTDRVALRTAINQSLARDRFRLMPWWQRQFRRVYEPSIVFLERQLTWRLRPVKRS
jgi:glycosyltransferase involved in cell wall biosynthesis